VKSAYSVPGRRRRRGRRRCRDAPIGARPEGNAKEVIRRRRRVTMAASNDDSVVAHSSLPAASRVSPSSVVCSTSPLAQTFPQLAQHVVERGALTHSHDSERSSLCSQRGSLRARALSSLRTASHRSPFRFSFVLFRELPRFSLSKIAMPPPVFAHPPTQIALPRAERPHTSLCSRAAKFSFAVRTRWDGRVCYVGLVCGTWDLPTRRLTARTMRQM